jgi:DUF971 family protein
MQPEQIKVENKEQLYIKWDNGTETRIQLTYLRDECPCANCKGETVLLKTYRPPKTQTKTPDMYRIKNIETVGGYAIQISWRDAHNTGIYSWDYLKKLEEDQEKGTSQNYDDIV